MGEAFVHISLTKAQKLLETDQETKEQEIRKLKDGMDDCETQMKDLKVVLYAKFGKAINLD